MESELWQLKALGRAIKRHRTPELSFQFGTSIPPRMVSDTLVEAYIHSFETVYRILHVPSFRRDCDAYWDSPGSAEPSFVIQLQLVMAIGCALYDDHFSMRESAIQWVYEARAWLITPKLKSKFNLVSLQIMALVCLARQTTSVGGDFVCVPMGEVVQTAVYMVNSLSSFDTCRVKPQGPAVPKPNHSMTKV